MPLIAPVWCAGTLCCITLGALLGQLCEELVCEPVGVFPFASPLQRRSQVGRQRLLGALDKQLAKGAHELGAPLGPQACLARRRLIQMRTMRVTGREQLCYPLPSLRGKLEHGNAPGSCRLSPCTACDDEPMPLMTPSYAGSETQHPFEVSHGSVGPIAIGLVHREHIRDLEMPALIAWMSSPPPGANNTTVVCTTWAISSSS